MTDEAPLLEASGVEKRFGAVVALEAAALTIRRGEIVALMGANGAGKSTFVKILTGALRADGGHVRIRGADRVVGSPAEARKSGLVPVYQEPSLIPDLDVTDNLRLGGTDAAKFTRWMSELGFTEMDLAAQVATLPLATLRIIDLARALASEPDVLLLQECPSFNFELDSACYVRCGSAPSHCGYVCVYVHRRWKWSEAAAGPGVVPRPRAPDAATARAERRSDHAAAALEISEHDGDAPFLACH